MKKLFILLVFLFFGVCRAAQVANVEYIHNAIKQKWDITIPYNPELTNLRVAANMKYLLTTVDVANEMLNGGTITDYGNGAFATFQVADTVAVDLAVETLVKFSEEPDAESDLLEAPYVFAIKTNATLTFSFDIAAVGTFEIDWGDGTTETKNQTTTDQITYSHTYTSSQPWVVRIGGQATGYTSSTGVAAISFASNSSVTEIVGSLGKIFPTLADGSQPSFYRTFYYNVNLAGAIPKKLFAGVKGAPIGSMFYQTFYNCSSLTELPEGLFGGLDGAPASSMFYQTFYNCSGLTGIPNNLFGNLYGTPALYMFYGVFYNCSGLNGEIPLGLFGNLDNYYRSYMFAYAFYNCGGLTGDSARMPDGTYLYDYFTTGTGYYPFSRMYYGCTQLNDYSTMSSGYR